MKIVCIWGVLLNIVWNAVLSCNISQLFNQSPLLLPSLRMYLPTLLRSVPLPCPSSALSPPVMWMYLLQCAMCFSMYIFSMWWSAYFEWEKYTLINLMCCRLNKIVVVMALSLMYSVSVILCLHLMFSIIPTPYISACSCIHRLPFLRFFHLSALTS